MKAISELKQVNIDVIDTPDDKPKFWWSFNGKPFGAKDFFISLDFSTEKKCLNNFKKFADANNITNCRIKRFGRSY